MSDAPNVNATGSCLRLFGRAIVMTPVGAVGIALTCTIIGAPLGIPILLAAGKWIAAPLQQHPNFKIPSREESLRAKQLRDGSYIEEQYLNDAQGYESPTEWMEER